MLNWNTLSPMLLYFVVLISIGFYSQKISKKLKDTVDFDEDFYLANRNISGVFIAFTTVATVMSAGTVVASGGVAYSTGFNWVYVALALQVGLGFVNIGCLGKKFAIVGRRIKAVTMLDFLRSRYESPIVVILGAVCILAFLGTYMMAQLQGGARVLQAITGFNYTQGLIIFSTIILIYVVIGGFRAVVYTDTFQGCFMIIGAVSLWLFGLNAAGGFAGLKQGLMSINPDMFTIPGPENRGSTWMAITYFIHIAFAMVVVPPAVTRAMSYPSSKDMHKAVSIGAVIGFVISLSYGFFGVLTRVILPNLAVPDMAIPSLYIKLFNPYVAGILLAAPIAAMITTVDSILLSLASTIAKDIYKNYIRPKANNSQMRKVSYISTICIMLMFTGFAIVPPSFVQWIVLFGLGGLGASFAAPLIIGLFWKRANKYGALAAMIVGVGSFSYFAFIEKLPIMQQTPAMVLAAIAMIVVSLVTPEPPQRILKIFWGKYPLEES